MTNEELVRHAYNCGMAWALKSETALTVDQFIEANLTHVKTGEMNYIISEKLREEILDALDHGAVFQKVGALIPVQSGGVVTRKDALSLLREWKTRWVDLPYHITQEQEGALADDIVALQLPAPNPQTEARGVEESFRIVWDESAFNAWNDRTYTFEKWLKSGAYYRALSHLQQAPQGVWDWIPVTERLPEIPFGQFGPYGIQVLCACFDEAEFLDGQGGYRVQIGHYSYDDDRIGPAPCPELNPKIEYKKGFQFLGYRMDGERGFEWEKNIPFLKVTHWQPLPPAPVNVDDHE